MEDKAIYLVEHIDSGWYKLSDSSVSGIKVLGLKQFLKEFSRDTGKHLVFDAVPEYSRDKCNYYRVVKITDNISEATKALNEVIIKHKNEVFNEAN